MKKDFDKDITEKLIEEIVDKKENCSRRSFLKKTGKTCMYALSIPVFGNLIKSDLFSAENNVNSTISVVKGQNEGKVLEKAIELAGGISKIVKRNDVVMLKPNIGFSNNYKMGTTTNPELMKKLIQLCMNAGAKKVRVMDNSSDDQSEAYTASGIKKVCAETGAELVYTKENRIKTINFRGMELKEWSVIQDFLECDKLINIPIAKDHSLTKLTLGMKNLFGTISGSRWELHGEIDKVCVDLARFFKPHLTVIDATRILIRNGPRGGSFGDVKKTDTIIAGTDYVACDAFATTLFNLTPDSIGCIKLAGEMNLGQSNLNRVKTIRATV